MEKIRYYTYLETLKKLTGEMILFENSSDENLQKIKMISERYDRILNLLTEKGFPDNSFFKPEEDTDPQEIYSNISLLLAFLREMKTK